MLIALWPKQAPAFRSLGKIRTLGVRAANVGAFEVRDHPLVREDVIAEGRKAWDAIFGTITLGKLFLGFGSIGICERALQEAVAHLGSRILYGRPVIEMPHIRSRMAEAYARLTAMKLYAYRALDYAKCASATDRRYLLFSAVQKAKVSTEARKTMALLQDCVGAKGFESDTYFEMALRDAQLIPSLEGSTHINLGLAVQFIPRYFIRPNSTLSAPPSLVGKETLPFENTYLMAARTGAPHGVGFPPYLDAYQLLARAPNVTLFTRQATTFREIALRNADDADPADLQRSMAMGECFSTLAYGQLIAENVARLRMPEEMTTTIFSMLVGDLSALALQLAATPSVDEITRALILKMVLAPKTDASDWNRVAQRCATYSSGAL
jgi:acyl-CoA dehydrogenase